MRVVLTVLLASFALAGCEGGGDPVEQALRETAAANQSAAVRETATAIDPVSADQAWVARMIEHHREAVAMADVALARSQDSDIRSMAQAVKSTRTREIAELQAWKPAASPNQ